MEKKSEIKNILIIMMIVLLMIGCGQQTEGNSAASGGVGSGLSGAMMEVGRSAEKAFYTFLELISDTLGFTAKTTTKKSDVGSYFSSLGTKLGQAATELEEVAKKAIAGIEKSDESTNPVRIAINTAKGVLTTLKGHLESLGTVGDDSVVGDAETTKKEGTAADATELKKAYNALKGIVDVAKEEGIEEPKAGDIAVKVGSSGTDNSSGAKILSTATTQPEATDAGKAAAILTTVSGKEILAAIVKSGEGDAALSSDAKADTSAMSFAKGGNGTHLAKDVAKASAVSGGIALRSLVKTGKLATGAADSAAGGKGEVQKIGITAVNKLLVAIEDIVKKTVKNVLDKAKTKIDEARKPKTAE
ncbi:variable large family protein [Borrelia miyamotoi]|uniref:Variable large protein n=1 Tax=Borrelia miyamotoi TaxID=47466 RepID=A0A5P8AXV6_9SPIR|nr:variable large family protein [Borrelia miyamotoi]ATQ18939.1 variable large family protein [Borrelia miyamotoi]ATQ19013.1 variable large family protein [Borrelia miyamotoi]ATQ19050.1 variable large family protein [Borrelia miyamotoi]WVI05730.1 variable large family protein [Borrelia miyamotoi]